MESRTLVVDLDGTLIHSDMLIESGFAYLKMSPHRFYRPLLWLAHGGKAHLKRQLAEGDQVVRRLTKIAIAARPQSMAGGQDEEPASGFADGAAARASSSFLPPSQSSSPQSSSPKVSSAKAVAAAAQAFSDRRRSAA